MVAGMRSQRAGAVAVVLAAASGLAVGVVLMAANSAGRSAVPAETELLGYPRPYEALATAPLAAAQPAVLGPRAASYVRRWSAKAEEAAMSPKEQLLALKAQGVPVIFPSKVIDESGNLDKMVRWHIGRVCSLLSSRVQGMLRFDCAHLLGRGLTLPRTVQAPGARSDAEAGVRRRACLQVLQACMQVCHVQAPGWFPAGVHRVRLSGGAERRGRAQGGSLHDRPHEGVPGGQGA